MAKKNRVKNNSKKQANKPGYSSYKQNTVFRQNMLALQRHYPDLIKVLEEIPGSLNYELRQTSTHLPTLFVKDRNLAYYDPVDPLKDVEKQIAELHLKNTRLAVFLGLGLGYEVLYYLDQVSKSQRTQHVLVIEKDPLIFIAALKTTNLAPVIENKRIKLLIGVAETNLYTLLRDYLAQDSKFMLIRAMNPVYHISSIKLHKDYYLKALQIFRESAAHQVTNFGDCPEDSLVGIQNMLDNLDEIISNPGVNLLFEKFKGKPAVVAATGPSLNKNKHLLKGLEDKALLIAADASLKVLLDLGVKPHLVTCLERVPETVELIQGVAADEVKDVYFAACPVVVNKTYKAYPGPKIIVYRQYDHFKWLGIERGMLPIKLSAGNMAFKVAEALGCDPIILIGQDLAFSRDGRTNAAGSVHGERQDSYLREQIIETMGNDGRPITTSKTLYAFLKSYEMDIAGYQGTCINSTEGGAYITGTRVMPFQEAIDQYIQDSFNPLETIRAYLGAFSVGEAEQDYDRILRLLNEAVEDMRLIIENCKKGIEAYKKHEEELNLYLKEPEKFNAERDKFSQFEAEILEPRNNCVKRYATFQLFFMHVIQSFHIKFEMEMLEIPAKHDDYDLALVEILLRHAEWYAVIGDIGSVCLNVLLQARENLRLKKNGGQ